MNGSTAIGTMVQQYASWDGVPQKFTLVPDGSNWRIAMTTDLSKCIDLQNNGTANSTRLVVNSCAPGDSSQQWTITPDAPTGAFVLRNVLAGRCLDEPNGTTASGLALQIYDCNKLTPQKWNIQAYPN